MNTPTSIVRTGQGEDAKFHEFDLASEARAFMAGWNTYATSVGRALMVRDGDEELADILWDLDNEPELPFHDEDEEDYS